ncbi:PLP-dependent aspartate aminotransferase family protein [Anthropogastromicrobium aceti]|jgi:cystathionine gamma-synthase|uniref:trans-sulfuration enzyme family protein n=1 Tax=Anthropogastromicrobium aceti TaxID=2981768 RepID=UPI000821CD01|nr:PLP-dependent aspartate aminotransferase family protein [Anthropogastromicrobium aceti]MCU6783284.1 PLP-dependent aspartate aminotransferase family protein [Anthropogastromicrobium aceti]SCJ23432.1 Cystathionine gamma-lyase [uncultured Lachnospira sp.]
MDYKFETRCIHRDNEHEEGHPYGSVCTPIYQTATFYHPGIGQTTGFNYTRESNPTRTELEDIVTSLEEAKDTVACANGMAAIVLCMELFESGDHIVCSEDLYGGSVRMFQTTGEKRGLTFTYVNTADAAATEAAIKSNTKALYIETPSNPTMQITDLAKMKSLADKYNLLVIVDNTFLSPYFQKPIRFGADIVIHSGTKFLGGHNDTLAGFLSTSRDDLAEKIRYLYKTVGSCLAPFDSYLLIRGIKTLPIRMERQQENALTIAKWLQTQKKIKQVYYIGLEDHPGYEINKKQTTGFGSMISIRTDSEATARRVLERIRLITYAESLGGVESLMTYPMLQTHGDVPVETRERLGITEDFLRFSVGIENVDDLIADLDQALNGED